MIEGHKTAVHSAQPSFFRSCRPAAVFLPSYVNKPSQSPQDTFSAAVCSKWGSLDNPLVPVLADGRSLFVNYRVLTLGLACFCLLISGLHAADPARIVVGISSTDDLFRDGEFLVANLAQRKNSWEKSVKQNVEYLLIGIAPDRPIRFDAILSDTGYRNQPIIPISNLKEFLNDNLNPIGINPKVVRAERGMYELTGQVYQGWLRSITGDDPYVIISKVKEDLPANLPHPAAGHDALVKAGYLLFAEMQNPGGNGADRGKLFDKFSQNLLDGLQKRPEESREAYELRRKWSEHQMQQFRQWFVECSHVRLGLKLDQQARTSTGELLFAAGAGSELANSIDQVATQGSIFSAIPKPEKSVLSVRVNWPVDAETRKRLDELYTLSEPVAEQAIRKDDKASAAVKDARVEFSRLLVDVFRKSADLSAVDLFADLVPTEQHHRLLLAVRCHGLDSLTAALAQLPLAEPGWKLSQNVGEVAGVKLHELDITESLTDSVKKFYGPSGKIYFGIGSDVMWLAAGNEARPALEAAIQQQSSAAGSSPNGQLVSIHLQALPLLQALEDSSKEQGFNLLDELRARGLLAPEGSFAKRQAEKQGNKTAPKNDKRPERAQQLASFEWKPIALESLKKQDGQFDLQLERTAPGTLTGSAVSTEGLLRALGAMIAQFADETLN